MSKYLALMNHDACVVRAKQIMKTMRASCDCGSDPRDPSWHAEGCAIDRAWDFAYDQATNEIGDYRWQETPPRKG